MPSSIQLQGRLAVQGAIIFSLSGGSIILDNFWEFLQPSPGTIINGFAVTTTTAGSYTVDWGDGYSTVAPSGSALKHSF